MFVDALEYEFLINLVKRLNINDDGIKFNQKMWHFLEKWKEGCPTSDDVEKSFQTIYQACLRDDELASKLVYLISSRTFISQKVRSKNIRLLFLSQLQKTIDGSGSLHKTNPVAFRNCTRMLGEFFNKGRFSNGVPFDFLAAPLVKNLQILLENDHPQDLQLLATQLHMNGSGLKAECPEQLTKLLNAARVMLMSNTLTKESELWLLLCIDGANNTSKLLPADLYKFYQGHIGEAATAIIQGTPSVLSAQTSQINKALDRYQDNVNILQVPNLKDLSTDKSSHFCASDKNTSNSSQEHTSGFRKGKSRWDGKPKGSRGDRSNANVPEVSKLIDPSTDESSQLLTSDTNTSNTSQGCTSGFVLDSSNHNMSEHYRDKRKQHDRPITGVGVRLNRYKTDRGASSTCKESKSGWNGKSKRSWGNQSNVPRVSKLIEPSTNKSSQLSTSYTNTSDASQRYTSGFVSDSSSHNTSSHHRGSSRNNRKDNRPIKGVGARLNRYKTDTEASSNCRGSESGQNDKSKRNNVNVSLVSKLIDPASTDKSSQLPTSGTNTSNSSQGYSSGFVSDSSCHDSSAHYSNNRKHGWSIKGFVASNCCILLLVFINFRN